MAQRWNIQVWILLYVNCKTVSGAIGGVFCQDKTTFHTKRINEVIKTAKKTLCTVTVCPGFP
jgi:hypothetical protein